MSYNQPGPYGQQPPQGPPGQPGPFGAPQPGGPPVGGPNPYGQGGAPGAPGYGYPQQPGQQPQAPYGQPQMPGQYGQQPPPGQFPGQAPYGQVPPPPQKSGNRTAIIAIAVVAALAVIGGGAFFLMGGDDESGPTDDGTRYTVSFPDSSGEYSQVPGEEEEEFLTDEELTELGLQNMEQDSAVFMNTDPMATVPEPGTIVVQAGATWGEVANPEEGVDGIFGLVTQAESEEDFEGELVGEPSVYSDDDAVLKCQQARGTEPDPDLGYEIDAVICVWGDYSTLGATVFVPLPEFPSDMDPESTEMPEFTAPEPVNMDTAAEMARQLRLDALVEAEGGAATE